MAANRFIAAVFGVVYVLIGLLGFGVTGFKGFAATTGKTLIIFDVNPLHNTVHLLVGALLIFGAASAFPHIVNATVGTIYLAVGFIGMLIDEGPSNILALGTSDNILHITTGVILLAVALREELLPSA